METQQGHERIFNGKPDRLRAPGRMAMLEVPRVVALCREGHACVDVLDVGTGTAIFAEAFASGGAMVTGVDLDAESLAAARSALPRGNFVAASAEGLPFPDRSFDLVFMGHVLHETDDRLQALKEARRVSRWRVAVLEWAYRDEPKGPPLAHRLKEDYVFELARQAGFDTVESVPLQSMILYLFTH